MISSSHLVRRGLPAFLVLIAALYCFPFVRPLHLESDSVCYLHAAELMAEGQGAGCPGCDRTHCSIQYPPGYPWVVSLLIRAGVATPATLVLLNVVGLLVALAAATGVWRRAYGLDSTVRLGLMALVGLCLPVYRYVVNPLSDFLFLGLALPSLFLMTMAASTSGWRRCSSLVLAAALAFGAFEVRTIGIALVPSFLWAALAQSRQVTSLWARIGRYRARTALLVAGLALVGVGIAVIASRSEYVTVDLRTQYARSAGATFIRVLGYHFTELGELAVNVPVGKLPPQNQTRPASHRRPGLRPSCRCAMETPPRHWPGRRLPGFDVGDHLRLAVRGSPFLAPCSSGRTRTGRVGDDSGAQPPGPAAPTRRNCGDLHRLRTGRAGVQRPTLIGGRRFPEPVCRRLSGAGVSCGLGTAPAERHTAD